MGTIKIEGMKFYACHGHYESEKLTGNQFIADIKIKTDCLKAAETDQLEFALNYQSVFGITQKEMAIRSRLIENVAHRILNAIYSNFQNIEKVSVRVSKINPPMGGETRKESGTNRQLLRLQTHINLRWEKLRK